MRQENQTPYWRQCVFCGAKPDNKNKEHVIPTWLQKFSGNRRSPANLNTPSGDINLTWADLTLPACMRCNQNYGELESLMKQVFERIEEGYITGKDIAHLLDWIDKVRVGIWRLQLTHGKNDHDIQPNFAISNRIGSADRLVRVFKYNTNANGIGLAGTDTSAFHQMPSAMCLIVKDIVILSVSAGGFLRERMKLIQHVGQAADREGKAYMVAKSLRDFDPSWGSDLFRFSEQRFFSFHGFGPTLGYEHDKLYTDKTRELKKLSDNTVFEIPTVSTYTPLLKPLILLEVHEIQRKLLQLYSKINIPNEFRPQLSRTYRQLDQRIEAFADAHDHIAPIPTYRRPYLRWV